MCLRRQRRIDVGARVYAVGVCKIREREVFSFGFVPKKKYNRIRGYLVQETVLLPLEYGKTVFEWRV